MNGRLFFVYFLGFLLLYCSLQTLPSSHSRPRRSRSFIPDRFKVINSAYKNRSSAALLNAFVSGNKRYIPKSSKKKFQILGLSHLFTPSGIHLSSLYILMTPFLKLVKNRLVILLPLLALSYFFTSFHSIKRILLMRTTKEWLKKHDIFQIFLISFIWDFFLGTYKLSPLSFSYSFIFLGIILSFVNSPKIYLPLALFGGQIITQFLSPYPLTTTGFFWNFLLTSLFGVLYPFFFLSYWFPNFPLIEGLLDFFYSIVIFLSNIAQGLGSFMPTFNHVLVCLYLSIGGRHGVILGVLLIFSSGALFNSELKYISKSSTQRKTYLHIEKTRQGYTSWHKDRVCRHRHTLTEMFIKCSYD